MGMFLSFLRILSHPRTLPGLKRCLVKRGLVQSVLSIREWETDGQHPLPEEFALIELK